MKICYISHKKHKSTKSTDFFQDLISDHDVDKFFLDETNYNLFDTIDKMSYDLVVIFQYDFLARPFLELGIATVIIPMYDGSAGYPDGHWKSLQGARVINFSSTLNHVCLENGLDSHYVKYFPNPKEFKKCNLDAPLRVFFWQRRPESLSWRTVAGLLKNNDIEKIHLHCSPDGNNNLIPTQLECEYFKISKSTWFENKDDLNKLLDSCNVYIAPRYAEGIGMAFLEAMARGMVCLAYDLPTHNEYIENGYSGILFNNDSQSASLDHAKIMGENARNAIEEGYSQWQKQLEHLKELVLSTPKPSRIKNSLFGDTSPARSFFETKDYLKKIKNYT